MVIFRLLLILEVAFLGIKAALGRENIADTLKQFVMLLLMAGFFYAVIKNYYSWAWMIINGLTDVAEGLTPNSYSADTPFTTALKLSGEILQKVSGWSPIDSLGLLIAAGVIIVCFALITAQVIFIKCEAMVTMMAALILVGFGGSSFVKDYAINAIRYVVSVAFKLFIMQLVLGIGISIITDFGISSEVRYEEIFITIGASVVLLALVKSLPDVIAGIINGSHVSSGSIGGAAATVGGTALAIGGITAAAVNTGRSAKDAVSMAGLEGQTGVGKMTSAAGNFMGARHEAKSNREKPLASRTQSAMHERLMQARLNSKRD